jgi:hypothetical protein
VSDFVLPESSWPSLPEPHARFLRAAIPRLQQRPELLGLAAAGSFVDGRMDEYSDLDLVIVSEPAGWPAILGERMQIASGLGSLLAAFTGEHVGEPRLLICLYGPPLVHVDLKFVVPAALAERVEDPVILWDRTGVVRERLAGGHAAYPQPELQWIEDRFWTWVHYTAAKIGRGELLEACDALAVLRAKVLGPLALRQAGARPSGVRRIETLAPRHAGAIRATVPRCDAADCVHALRAAIGLYRELRDAEGLASLARSPDAEDEAVLYLDAIVSRVGGGGAAPV